MSGKGAEISGGRWNSKGVRMIYTSATRSLCTLEIAVRTPLGNTPVDYRMISIQIPDTVMTFTLNITSLHTGWRSFPHSGTTQQTGDAFISKNKNLIMKVPSAIIEDEFNYLINPAHPEISKLKIISNEPFNFDKRIFKK